MKKLFFWTVLFFGVLVSSAHAQKKYSGSISFTSAEKQLHLKKIDDFVAYGSQCLQDYRTRHLNFYSNNCIRSRKTGSTVCLSRYFGDRRYSKGKNQTRADGEPLTWLGYALMEHGWSPNKMNEMQNISCVGMAINCLRESFIATGQNSAWDKIRYYVVAQNGTRGNVLLHALSFLGWKTMYWNPVDHADIPAETAKWDAEEADWKSKGHHFWRYRNVMNKGFYWGNTVNDRDSLVGFGQQPPALLYRIPFWVGIAHTGYHVFPGTYQEVVEAHSTRDITSRNNLEFSDFNPMAYGGGPRWTNTEKYRSGLIAIPPVAY